MSQVCPYRLGQESSGHLPKRGGMGDQLGTRPPAVWPAQPLPALSPPGPWEQWKPRSQQQPFSPARGGVGSRTWAHLPLSHLVPEDKAEATSLRRHSVSPRLQASAPASPSRLPSASAGKWNHLDSNLRFCGSASQAVASLAEPLCQPP